MRRVCKVSEISFERQNEFPVRQKYFLCIISWWLIQIRLNILSLSLSLQMLFHHHPNDKLRRREKHIKNPKRGSSFLLRWSKSGRNETLHCGWHISAKRRLVKRQVNTKSCREKKETFTQVKNRHQEERIQVNEMPSHVSSREGCVQFFFHSSHRDFLVLSLVPSTLQFLKFSEQIWSLLRILCSSIISLSPFALHFFKETEWTDEEKKIIILKFCTAFSSLYTFLLYSSCLQYTFLFMTSSLSSSSQVFTWGMIRSFSSCLVPSSSSFFFSSHSFDFSTNNKFSLFTLSLSSSLFLSLPVWLLGQRMGREERGEERGEGKREKSERKMKE